MREIKFRAWDKKNRRMEFGTLFNLNLSWTCKEPQLFGSEINNFSNLMQYTGLKDKNGVEIYEGDILKVGFEPYTDEDEDGNDIDAYAETWNTKVSWSSDGGYVLNAPAGHDFWGEYNSTLIGWAVGDGEYELEVIGNIYENPELLKESS